MDDASLYERKVKVKRKIPHTPSVTGFLYAAFLSLVGEGGREKHTNKVVCQL
jgi:hypothetical protein